MPCVSKLLYFSLRNVQGSCCWGLCLLLIEYLFWRTKVINCHSLKWKIFWYLLYVAWLSDMQSFCRFFKSSFDCINDKIDWCNYKIKQKFKFRFPVYCFDGHCEQCKGFFEEKCEKKAIRRKALNLEQELNGNWCDAKLFAVVLVCFVYILSLW